MSIENLRTHYLYQFVGGELDGLILSYQTLKLKNVINGYSEDLTEKRNKGFLCKREELDNQPIIKGYLGPMYGGDCYLVHGQIKKSYKCTDEVKKHNKHIHIIRYETQKVYDMLSC